MKLLCYYRKAAIYPSLFILFFCIIYTLISNISGWPAAKSGIIISIVATVIYSFIMCLLSMTIFLNKLQKLNKNLFWNILTWFLLPSGYIIIVWIHDIKNRIMYDFGFGFDFIYLVILTAPFAIGLFTSFIKYRKKIRVNAV